MEWGGGNIVSVRAIKGAWGAKWSSSIHVKICLAESIDTVRD